MSRRPRVKASDVEKPQAKFTVEKTSLPDDYVFGRPTLYKPELCQQLIEHMAEGNSFWTFAAKVQVSMQTLNTWTKKYPDFLESKKIGNVFEMQWWENLHKGVAKGQQGNATLIIWAQKNKWRNIWKERLPEQKTEVKLTHTMDMKQLVATMNAEQLMQLASAVTSQIVALPVILGNKNEPSEATADGIAEEAESLP